MLERLDLTGGELGLVFQVHNPNAFRIRGTGLEVGLALEDVPFGDVALTDPLALPARETREVRVPLAFFWSGVGAGAKALLQTGAVHYAVDGGLHLETPFGVGRVPYRRSGTVSLVDRRAAADGEGR